PLSQTEAKSVLSDLKDWGRDHAAVARLLGEEGPLKDFIVAALSLSPYLRDTARIDPGLLARALEEPILPAIEAAIGRARAAWRAEEGEVAEAVLMTRLRVAKREVAFLTALA